MVLVVVKLELLSTAEVVVVIDDATGGGVEVDVVVTSESAEGHSADSELYTIPPLIPSPPLVMVMGPVNIVQTRLVTWKPEQTS